MQTNFHTKYKVECKIGEGSFSEVLKCQERSSGKFVAAKQLKKHFKSLNHASEIPELLVLQKVSKHPNLLELFDSYYDASKGKVTLVFELMDMSLYDFMKTRKRPIPESRAKRYLFQIVKGIDHLHYHGIFHRDIKPENVLVKGEQVKISDMGSIKGVYSKQPYTEYISTRWYRSPECLLTKGFYGPKMDIWAIGCVYYELITLKPLFPGSDELDQISKINYVLGTPSVKLINKLKKMKCRNMVPSFPSKKGTGLNSVIPMITNEGREIFKQMIVYDPDSRINVRRLLEHKYFNDMRHEEILSQRIISCQSAISSRCKVATSPMWLSFITATRKRRIKDEKVNLSKRSDGKGKLAEESVVKRFYTGQGKKGLSQLGSYTPYRKVLATVKTGNINDVSYIDYRMHPNKITSSKSTATMQGMTNPSQADIVFLQKRLENVDVTKNQNNTFSLTNKILDA